MDVQDLVLTALRATLIYFFLLVVVRLLGKRSVGSIGAFDLLVALMLGEVVDEAIFGDVTLAKGLLAISVIGAWHFVNGWASYRSETIDRLAGGTPTVLVKGGEFQRDALARERLNEAEVYSQMRLNSVEELDDIEEAILEPSGHISFRLREAARPLEKGDLARVGRKAS